MSSQFQSRPASRGSVKPLVAFYSESGGGKSYSALLLARGLVGPTGNIQLIDSEGGRGELYSDVIPGGYNVIPFTEPFTPARYIEAIAHAESLKADVIIIDQASSEWDGAGGILDMAGDNEDSGKRGLSVWKVPKLEHAKLVQKFMRSVCPIIVCLRAKYKSRQVKQNGKTEIVKDDHLTPVQDEAFIFETTVHGYMTQDHAFHPVKISHPSLGSCFPNGTPITIEHGALLAKWCASPGQSPTGAPKPADQKKLHDLKRRFFDMTKTYHHGNTDALQQWCWDESLIGLDEKLADLSVERLEKVISKTEAKLKGVPA